MIIVIFFGVYKHLLDHHFSDLYEHLKHAVKISKKEKNYPPNFLLYAIVNLGHNFSAQKNIFALLMSVSIYLKFALTFFILKKQTKITNFYHILLISFALLFIYSIPSLTITENKLYFGNFVPTTWHNSTTIFLMPFALSLFYMLFYRTYTMRNALIILILFILNIIIKPSFVFVIVSLLGSLIIWKIIEKRGIDKEIKLYFVYILFAVFFIFIQYLFIYQYNVGSIQEEKSSVSIGLFKFYSLVSPIYNLPVAILASYAFPISCLILKRESLDKTYWYSWILVLYSIIILLLFFEEGPRFSHGNFYWQIIPSSFLLYLTSIIILIKNWSISSIKLKFLPTFTLTISIFVGIFYLLRLITLFIYC